MAIVHGLGEHSGRYESLAERLADRGYAVIAADLPGHGRSPGKRGHATYGELLESVEWLHGEAHRVAGDRPVFLYGHSLGGNLLLNYALKLRPALVGMVVASPLLRPTRPPPQWKLLAARLLVRVWPAFAFATRLEPEQLSHDALAVESYRTDPLVHHVVSARLGTQMLDAGRWALEHASELRVPTLLMHGGVDSITSARATAEFAEKAGPACEVCTGSA